MHDQSEDPASSLQIVVNSVPDGAGVYGYANGSPGQYLGKTPLVLKYFINKRAGFSFYGPKQTLRREYNGGAFSMSLGLTFDCFVVQGGYVPLAIRKTVLNKTASNNTALGSAWNRLAGRTVRYTALLQPLQPAYYPKADNLPQQQQQQQQQTVVVPQAASPVAEQSKASVDGYDKNPTE